MRALENTNFIGILEVYNLLKIRITCFTGNPDLHIIR